MNTNRLQTILSCMPSDNEIQQIQTEHRLKLAEFWGIEKGKRVLEIGCGQGDTTVVLAYLVGEDGLVHGVDIGSASYGAPITLGDSASYIMKSALGKQIKMEFEVDILSTEIDFPDHSFDYIVLSHCSWYFSSAVQLEKIFQKIRKWGKQLCFAEWDTRIQSLNQYPHLLSILIQAQYEAFKQQSEANVRTLFTPNDIQSLLESSGWKTIKEQSIVSPKLQDGEWEISYTLKEIDTMFENSIGMPEKLKLLIKSEINILKEFIQTNNREPLSIFAFVAE
ncbi:class I SAM-dependent methyltransferase [Caldibacillus lycopersici]|uniref:Class I SAM-dependent methyltransferase n=1 Tax=Perspicuibacillus lycopersici TaxID=1325689 RepID=A0AAE3LLY5_9BACI|nr:class I SAM-dependent methyltransferase [Perspicuibacillus lycopersici]MCU9612401.1 class I SAM-dependent methyltransferase [Perspicuibacillus lycopersici]